MNAFVFFHVGEDLVQPSRLVESIHRSNPDSEVVMVTDPDTPKLQGVTSRIEIKGDRNKIMLMRLAGFAAAQAKRPAIYLDTDMVVKDKINVEDILGDKDAVLCRRTFNRDAIFNHNLRGMDFREYEGMTLDQVYPYLACATVTRDWSPWGLMVKMMDFIDPKFQLWYGDQEALRLYAKVQNVGELDESEYACLPEFENSVMPTPKIIHYKGGRK